MSKLLKVTGIGSMHVEPIGLLSRVLHVPKLFVSLVSVQRIAKLREYEILFHESDVLLCNKVNGWKIGLAKVLITCLSQSNRSNQLK